MSRTYFSGKRCVVAPADIAGHLSQVHARLGVYAVLGSHDNWYGSPAVTATLTRAGTRVLSNSVIELDYHHRIITTVLSG